MYQALFFSLSSQRSKEVKKKKRLISGYHAGWPLCKLREHRFSVPDLVSSPLSRWVFDYSGKYLGTSLNDQLLQRPDLTNSLVGGLSRYREEQIALMVVVEAMFHQVRVRPSDFDALRFLWWPNGNLDNEPKEYQMRVNLFGGASSPSCANFALTKTAQDNKTEFDLQTIETVQHNFYVVTVSSQSAPKNWLSICLVTCVSFSLEEDSNY